MNFLNWVALTVFTSIVVFAGCMYLILDGILPVLITSGVIK